MQSDVDSSCLPVLAEALEELKKSFDGLPSFDPEVDVEAFRTVMLATARRMEDNYPYQHPFYLGQMLKPPHPIARYAYALAMFINPNNHALDGGRASSAMEKEAVAQIARQLFGWDVHLGHLTSGGTMANLEALWIGGRLRPGATVVASDQAHYTHGRITEVLGIPFRFVPSDLHGRMDCHALQQILDEEDVGMVVVTIGTTIAGAVDPLSEILSLRERYEFRIHADAAYGGYFGLANNLGPDAAEAFARLGEVDSLAIDPHKHGLQPYGCGCVLFRDPSVGTLYHHDSPYTYFTSKELHLGEISLECSRAGASAVALWATQQLLPMVRGGGFAQGLEECRAAALDLARRIDGDERFRLVMQPELDIVAWAPAGSSASEISRRSRQFFDRAAARDIHLAVADFPARLVRTTWDGVEWDRETVTCLRACLMKPEHLAWLDRIWQVIDGIAGELVRPRGHEGGLKDHD